jgi:SRSO17 transposase
LYLHTRYHNFFIVSKKSVIKQSRFYLCGLFQSVKANMERIEESVINSDYESMQHFISDSPWQHQPVLDQIAKDVNHLIGNHQDSYLLIDESAFSKKGKGSVGVARQWNGRLGKVDNCQVGVFAALGCGDYVTLTDTRLYLPEEWTNDKARCLKAGIPEEHQEFKTKLDHALDMVKQARENKINYSWVGADALYGNDFDFRESLDELGEIYMVDIHKDTTIFPEEPIVKVPEKTSSRGRVPTRFKAMPQGIRLDKWIQQQDDSSFKTVTIRDSSKGSLTVKALHRMIWLWDGESEKTQKVHLVVRLDGSSQSRLKYSVSNAPEETTLERLAFQQAQRFWIERAFQDAKSNAGMAEYQVRGWTAWHHHITMVLLAMLFMLEIRINNAEAYDLLSAADIKELLTHLLPQRKVDEDEIFRQLEIRHKKRRDAIRNSKKT